MSDMSGMTTDELLGILDGPRHHPDHYHRATEAAAELRRRLSRIAELEDQVVALEAEMQEIEAGPPGNHPDAFDGWGNGMAGRRVAKKVKAWYSAKARAALGEANDGR